LHNVARHARADHVEILLRRGPAELHLEVHDNGAGFAARKPSEPMGYGLTGMRERALALGGTFRIAGQLGLGTTVAATLPLAAAGVGAGDPSGAILSVRELLSAAS
jgi:signal transduction histidine kinase